MFCFLICFCLVFCSEKYIEYYHNFFGFRDYVQLPFVILPIGIGYTDSVNPTQKMSGDSCFVLHASAVSLLESGE